MTSCVRVHSVALISHSVTRLNDPGTISYISVTSDTFLLHSVKLTSHAVTSGGHPMIIAGSRCFQAPAGPDAHVALQPFQDEATDFG